MNGSISGAKAPVKLVPWLAVCAALALPLSGCMSSGASSFVDVLAVDKTGSVADNREIALDIVTQPPAAAAPAMPQTAFAEPEKPAALARSYAPAAKYQLASVAPVSAGTERRLNDPLAFPQLGLDSPEEAAAEARIPALYARVDHGQCEGGWGPKPTMRNATRMQPGEPYYMEMRLRHTPPLPVGHVYIAYGRLGPNGEPVDEKLVMLAPVGGYGGATIAAAVPMPGVLKPYGDDCKLRPIASYRRSLSAVKYEKLLLEIQRQIAKKPSYALFAYNCNHFMSDVAESVGVLPPKNLYVPSLQYFYDMMDRNEGRKVARTPEDLREEATIAAASAALPQAVAD